jgi:hypothetical protein
MSADSKNEPLLSASDPPRYRPRERFWPYVELPEQLTDEEIAKLDPDLHAELFGAPKRPLSVTLVFPVLDSPDYARAVELARASAEYRETGRGRRFVTARVSGRRMPPSSAICSSWSDGSTPATCSSTIGRSRMPASCGFRSFGF